MARASTGEKGSGGKSGTAARQPEVSAEEAQRIGRRIAGEPPPRDGRDRPSDQRLYFARRPIGYAGQQFDREQKLQLVGLVNDAKLVDLKYLAPWPEDTQGFTCRHCPATFLTMSGLNAHGDRRHAPPKPPPTMAPRRRGETEDEFDARETAFLASVQAEEDAEIARDERMLDTEAPLDLTMTTASRRG